MIIALVNIIRVKQPNSKTILIHLTPQEDKFDTEVKICNQMLNESMPNLHNIFLVNHDNVSDTYYAMLHDSKHK